MLAILPLLEVNVMLRTLLVLLPGLLAVGAAIATETGADEFSGDVLALVNQARQSARTCGAEGHFPAAPPVGWSPQLAGAAEQHSRGMAAGAPFSHRNAAGHGIAERAQAAGYSFRALGENIYMGEARAANAVASWLDSPGHCVNLMSADFSEIGAGVAYHPVKKRHFWTLMFGTPLDKTASGHRQNWVLR